MLEIRIANVTFYSLSKSWCHQVEADDLLCIDCYTLQPTLMVYDPWVAEEVP